jgi:CRP/FNR family transcriptional regulator, cyclic AMP receptor protein
MLPTLVQSYQNELEDPLSYLPLSDIEEYPKGQVIFHPEQSAKGLYLVINGTVRISRLTDHGRQVVIDVYQADDLFGESCILNLPPACEQAMALDKVKLMMWSAATVQELLVRRPGLALALLQILVRRTAEFKERIESFSADRASRRLARALLRISERLGTPQDDGSVRIVMFTHELLAQYVGTTREVVTEYMNQFRSLGFLIYSRRDIYIYREGLRDWLTKNA